MKQTIGVFLAGTMVFLTLAAQAAQKSGSAVRNLDWAGTTLDKVEKDLAEVARDNKLTDANSLVSAFQSARVRLATLKKAVTATEPDPGDLAKAVDFTRTVVGLAQSVLEQMGDLDGKRKAYRDLITDNPSLASTDIGKRFDEAFRSLAGDLARIAACQLEEKQVEAGEAEGEWNLQALRCDQIVEEGADQAAYLAKKEELKNNMREAGKTISLSPLGSAREQVTAAKRQQQEAALEKQKLANQISQLNLQNQLLEEKTAQLDEAARQASEDCDQAEATIQQAIDADSQ